MYGYACEASCLLLKVPRSQIFFFIRRTLPCSNIGTKKGKITTHNSMQTKAFFDFRVVSTVLGCSFNFVLCLFFFRNRRLAIFLGRRDCLFSWELKSSVTRSTTSRGKTILFWACIERNFWKWEIWVKTCFKIVIYIRKYSCSSFLHQDMYDFHK